MHFSTAGGPRSPDAAAATTATFDAGLVDLGHLAVAALAHEDPLALRAIQAGVPRTIVAKQLPGFEALVDAARKLSAPGPGRPRFPHPRTRQLMTTLNDYIGTLVAGIADARAAADLESVRVAEAYAQHALLKHFSVPRMRIGDIEMTIPVAIDGLSTRSDLQLAPMGNDAYKTDAYRVTVRSASVSELPQLASNDLATAIGDALPVMLAMMRDGDLDGAFRKHAETVATRFGQIVELYQLDKVLPDLQFTPDRTIEELYKHTQSSVQGVIDKPVLDSLSVVAESYRLREQRPEDLIRIRMVLSEEGMEWTTIEREDGSVERRLLPE